MTQKKTSESSPGPHRPRPISELNFVALSLVSADGVSKQDNVFSVDRPWQEFRFGKFDLRGGWWRLEFQSATPDIGIELRLRSTQNPLLTIQSGIGKDARVLLAGGLEPLDVSLLVSAWPGVFEFSRCRFMRLSAREEAALIARGVTRIATRADGPALLSRVVRRVLAGQAIGIEAGHRESPEPKAPAHAQRVGASGVRVVKKGSVTAVLREGDLLHPDAFAIAASELQRRPEVKAAFADVVVGGRIRPHPEWDEELARHFPFPDAPFFVRSGDEPRMLADLAKEHGAGAVVRIPLPLVQRDIETQCPEAPEPRLHEAPRVSVILPTKYRMDLLALCLDGLANRTGYPNLQVVVVNNGSTDPGFSGLLEQASRELDLIRVDDFGSFNFPRLIDAGVKASNGEILLLLNDDVQPTTSGWLARMVESVVQNGAGAVGARLIYPDGGVQHAGVALGLSGVCGHLWKGLSSDAAAANPYVSLPGTRSAVTAACLAVRRSVYDQVDGMDAEAFSVALNDIDFCLRLQKLGYRNIYRGDAVLVHHESQSRGLDDANLKKRKRLSAETRIFLKRWSDQLQDDPWSSPAFDLTVETGAVHPATWGRKPYVDPDELP
jgi:GT2 family glycosyltransferase